MSEFKKNVNIPNIDTKDLEHSGAVCVPIEGPATVGRAVKIFWLLAL
jgi:hypothetical protein